MEIVNNDFTIEIEGEIYHINDYYLINDFNEIVIVGKKYNYLLIKDKNKFEFDVIKYDKNILRCYNDNDAFIYLNGKKLMQTAR